MHADTAPRGKMSVPAFEAEVQELRATIKGRVLLPGQDQDARAVEEALRVWAVSPALAAAGRRPAPALIVQPRGKWGILVHMCAYNMSWKFHPIGD